MSDQQGGESLPPDWAIERAVALLSEDREAWDVERGTSIRAIREGAHYPGYAKALVFARYIAKHEEAPVDPCLIAGRALVVETQHDWPDSPWHMHEAAETLAGKRDHTLVVMAAVEGVRRGMELASTNASREASDV